MATQRSAGDCLDIANSFCELYYDYLSSKTESLHEFYAPEGNFSHFMNKENSHLNQIRGKDNIQRALQASIFDIKGEVQRTFCDAQLSINDSVLIVVGGFLTRTVDNIAVPFVQTFLLVCAEAGKFNCMNSVFRVLDVGRPSHGEALHSPSTVFVPSNEQFNDNSSSGNSNSSSSSSSDSNNAGKAASTAPVIVKTSSATTESATGLDNASAASALPVALVTASASTTSSTTSIGKKADVQAQAEDPDVSKKHSVAEAPSSLAATAPVVEISVSPSDKGGGANLTEKTHIPAPVVTTAAAATSTDAKKVNKVFNYASVVQADPPPTKEEKSADKPVLKPKPANGTATGKETAVASSKDGKDVVKSSSATATAASASAKKGGDNKKDVDSRTVFVFGTNSQKREDLSDLFSKFGIVTKIDQPDKNQYSFIEFHSDDVAKQVVEKGQIQAKDGTMLRVEFKGNKTSSSPASAATASSSSSNNYSRSNGGGGAKSDSATSESKDLKEVSREHSSATGGSTSGRDRDRRRSGGAGGGGGAANSSSNSQQQSAQQQKKKEKDADVPATNHGGGDSNRRNRTSNDDKKKDIIKSDGKK